MYEQMTIIGRLGGDPEMRYTPSGVPVTNFDVAVTRRWRDRDGNQQERTKWVRVTAWRKLAEICNEHLSKGRLVFVQGEASAEPWLGQDGKPRATLALTAETVKFLGGKGKPRGEGREVNESIPTTSTPGAWGDDEIPF